MTCLALPLWITLLLTAPPEADLKALSLMQSQTNKVQKENRVWTNEDLEQLRSRSFISTVGQEPRETPTVTAEHPGAEESEKAGAKTEPIAPEKDPKTHRQQLEPLRAELERIESEIRQIREFRASGQTAMGGLDLTKENISLTPENHIQQLEARRREVQSKIDEIEDEARRNGIAPGDIR